MSEFIPADGVTIENALRYLEAIEQAIKRDITLLPKSDRSMMLGIMGGSLAQASENIFNFRQSMEKSGDSLPTTEEQKELIRATFRQALAKDKPDC